MKNMNSHAYEVELFHRMTPTLRYDGKEPFDIWQKRAREKLIDLLGLPLIPGNIVMDIEYTIEYEGYIEYRFTVETEPGYHVPCHLLIPRKEGKIPLTLCLSGHGGGMHIALGKAKCEKDEDALREWHHRAMAPRAIREGRAALVIEARNFGECSLEGYGTSCTEAGKIAILMGRTTIGERVWDAMRIMDAVEEQFDCLDMSDIVCTGNSGGGTATFYLACVDERITVAMPSCSVCTFEQSIAAKRHCMCNYIPGIRRYFEMGDMAGLIAPRRLIIAAGITDPGFYIKGSRDAYAQAQAVYTAIGMPERCAFIEVDNGHLNYADEMWAKFHEMTRTGV